MIPSNVVSTAARYCARLKGRARWVLAGALSMALMGVVLVSLVEVLFPVPWQRLQDWPTSAVVTDRTGRMLLRQVGSDDQWRFPVSVAEMSPWLLKATIAAEDARFESHPGVDVLAVARAIQQNAARGRVVSGASTLTMQLCRMLDDRPRTLFSKLVDSVRAINVERHCSKSQIIEHYLNVAPYGGNIRGVEAAAQMYFGKSARELSLGEAALLAGIPQQPSRLRPDIQFERCLRRRDYVLTRMVDLNLITAQQAHEARQLPLEIHRERQTTVSQAGLLALQRHPRGGQLTLDLALQERIEQAVVERRSKLPAGTDIAVVVLDIPSSEVRALVGSADPLDPIDGQINGALAKRSPGSALKPFLYATAFEAQRLGPDSIVIDDPQQFADWTPDNFDREFAGRLTVAEALRASRNIPAIQVTQAMGLERCLGVLEACGLNMPPDASQRSGLTLAVGGIEVTLFDLTNAYATLGRRGEMRPVRWFLNDPESTAKRALSAQICDSLNDILSSQRRRPNGIGAGVPVPWFMWKTGTSSGRRDAWAIGHNQQFAIGVWVGRFSGIGHHEFVGKDAAEPLLARLFCEPSLKSNRRPVSPEPWPIIDPLPLPDIASKPIVMTSPVSGEIYIAVEGRTVIHPKLSRDFDRAHWFLNQRYLGTVRPERLELTTGSHELRCVSDAGVLTSRFRVE